jgi:hypothetical protein
LSQHLLAGLESRLKAGRATMELKPLRDLIFGKPLAQSLVPVLRSIIESHIRVDDAVRLPTFNWLWGAGNFAQEVLDEIGSVCRPLPEDLEALVHLRDEMHLLFTRNESEVTASSYAEPSVHNVGTATACAVEPMSREQVSFDLESLLDILIAVAGDETTLVEKLAMLVEGEVIRLKKGQEACSLDELNCAAIADKIRFIACVVERILTRNLSGVTDVCSRLAGRLIRCLFAVVELSAEARHAFCTLPALLCESALIAHAASQLWKMLIETAATGSAMQTQVMHVVLGLASEMEQRISSSSSNEDDMAELRGLVRCLCDLAKGHLLWLDGAVGPAAVGLEGIATGRAEQPATTTATTTSGDESEDIPTDSSEEEDSDEGSDLDDFIDTSEDVNSHGLLHRPESAEGVQPGAAKKFRTCQLVDDYKEKAHDLFKCFEPNMLKSFDETSGDAKRRRQFIDWQA